jgi:NTP pyrophosphatase (non-canonical NTP hydrolase)
MTYYLYHIPGKKIGVTRDLKYRVEKQQGYNEGEYDVILSTDDIAIISEAEISLQKAYGYRVDETPYNELKFNNKEMNINITEATTTFPCPANKLKGRLMDNIGMSWETDHGDFIINKHSIDWIMRNVQTSRYNNQRCYVYNKAFSRFYDNHQTHDKLGGNLEDVHMRDQYNGKCRSGALSPTGIRCKQPDCENESLFDCIRQWADERGLYEHGDPKTQSLKLVEEVGEICRATLKEDHDEVIDGIGDAVVVLTNLAELHGVTIEECIASAYGVISKRTGKMVNGTFKKD